MWCDCVRLRKGSFGQLGAVLCRIGSESGGGLGSRGSSSVERAHNLSKGVTLGSAEAEELVNIMSN